MQGNVLLSALLYGVSMQIRRRENVCSIEGEEEAEVFVCIEERKRGKERYDDDHHHNVKAHFYRGVYTVRNLPEVVLLAINILSPNEASVVFI